MTMTDKALRDLFDCKIFVVRMSGSDTGLCD